MVLNIVKWIEFAPDQHVGNFSHTSGHMGVNIELPCDRNIRPYQLPYSAQDMPFTVVDSFRTIAPCNSSSTPSVWPASAMRWSISSRIASKICLGAGPFLYFLVSIRSCFLVKLAV